MTDVGLVIDSSVFNRFDRLTCYFNRSDSKWNSYSFFLLGS